jgi:hypothetical protein
MLVALVPHSIWASAVLVWSTRFDEGRRLSPQRSWGGFEYVAIPDHSFFTEAVISWTTAKPSGRVIVTWCYSRPSRSRNQKKKLREARRRL